MILSVRDLAFSYPSRSVLDEINFSICKGSFLAVLGINGAGKSTLLKVSTRKALCGTARMTRRVN